MLHMDLNQQLSPSLLASEQLYQEIPPDPNVLILKETDKRPILEARKICNLQWEKKVRNSGKPRESSGSKRSTDEPSFVIIF